MAALVGAACVAVLRLPLASVMIASLLSAKAGLAVAPLIVVAVAVAYLASETLTAFVDARVGAAPAATATDSPAACRSAGLSSAGNGAARRTFYQRRSRSRGSGRFMGATGVVRGLRVWSRGRSVA